MNSLSQSNYRLAQIILQRSLVEKTLLEKALSRCNEQQLHLSQFLVQHQILSTAQIAQLSKKQTRQFGKYTVIDELARGGMGVVYRAKSIASDRVVVLKTLLHNSNNQVVLVKRFLKEAQTVASLSHPNIVQLYDYGECNGVPYFTMQYVPGINFSDFLLQSDDLRACIQILLKVTHALHYAHEKGIVHRDIKPENILLDNNNEPYLADFGLVKTEDKTSSLTQTGNVIGTPFFLSPEQALGNRKHVTKSADIYALGVILYLLLTKQYPFKADDLSLLLRKIDAEIPVAPQKINPQIPKQLNYLCLKAISKKIENRHATALEFAEDLQQFLENPQVVSRSLAIFSAKMWWRNTKAKLAMVVCATIIFLTAITVWQYSRQQSAHREKLRSQAYFKVENLIQQKKYALALSEINLFLQTDTTPRMIVLKARVYYAQNAIPVARELFAKALSLPQQDDEILFVASKFYHEIGEDKRALKLATQAIEVDKTRGAYYRLRARIYDKLNQPEQSKKDDTIARKIKNADVQRYLQKLQSLQQQHHKAMAITEEILRLYPDCAEAYRERGKIFYQLQDLTSAINDITQAVGLQPSFANYTLQATWLKEGGYYQDALGSYYKLLRYDEKVEFYQQILQLHCDLGQYNEAIAVYEKISTAKTMSLFMVMAKIHFLRKDYLVAKRFIDKVDKVQSSEFLYLRGMIYFHLRFVDIAYNSLQKLLNDVDELSRSQQFDVLRTLADILMHKGNDRDAKEFLRKAVDIYPDDAGANFLLGTCYERLHDLKPALELYTKSIHLEPWQQKFYYQRGDVHFKLKKWLAAHHDFLKCIELGSRSTQLVSQLFNTTFNEGWTFDRMLMMSIIFDKMFAIYGDTEIDLFGEQKQELAKHILGTSSPKRYVVNSTKKVRIAQQFLQRLNNNSSTNVKNIAANGLKSLYYIPEVLDLVKRAVKNNPTSQILKVVHEEMYRKQLNEVKIVLKKLLITHFTAKDNSSLLQIYNNREVYTNALQSLVYEKEESPFIRCYAAEVLILMCTQTAYQIIQKAVLSTDVEVAVIAAVAMAKYKRLPERKWGIQELYSLPTFLKVQYIENVAQQNIELWLRDDNVYVQLCAIQKMWLSGNTTPLKFLVKFCKNAKPVVRAFALRTMWQLQGHTPEFGKYITEKYVDLLVKAMDDASAKVRQIAVLSAQKISSPQCRKKLHEKTHDSESIVRSQAIIGLALQGEFSVVADITLNPKEDFAMRLMPFAYFEGVTSKTNVPVFAFANTLQRLTQDSDARLRSIAIAYLMKAGGGKVAKFFISQIDAEDVANRFAIVAGLGSSRNVLMIPYLMKIAKEDPNIEIRKVACYSTVRILLSSDQDKLAEFHRYLMTQEKEIRESASIGYTYGVYEVFYRSQKKASSARDIFENDEYRRFLYNIENSIEQFTPELRRNLEFRWTKAYELAQKDHQCFSKGVVQYLCGKKQQALQTLSQCNLTENALYAYWLARVYFDEQKYAQAQQQITKAVLKYPWDRKVIELHAHIEQKMGNRLLYQDLMERIAIMKHTISKSEVVTRIPVLFIYKALLPKMK